MLFCCLDFLCEDVWKASSEFTYGMFTNSIAILCFLEICTRNT